MSDLASRLEAARRHVNAEWTPDRERRVRAALDARLRRRRRTTLVLAAALLAVAAVCVVVGARWVHHAAPVAHAPAPPRPAGDLLDLPDGSAVRALGEGTDVRLLERSGTGTAVRVVSGTALFDVAPQHGRAFRVLAGGVTVTVVGTRFSVGLEAAGVRVRVERGRVQVEWSGGSTLLGAGEQQLFPASAPPAPGDDAGAAPAQRPAPRAATSAPAAGWRDLAQAGHYAAAYRALAAAGAGAVRDDPADLLLAADVARLGGHPDAAVSRLRAVVERHPGDPRASLAAFTLGRVELDDLGRPREAAQAFATARRLAPRGALAEDALAREVEAWSRAGDTALARARAEEFVRLYPDGRGVAAVKRLGGLD